MSDTSPALEQAAEKWIGFPPTARAQQPTTAGIVAEYNPFHKGHEWMVHQLRAGGVDCVVCVMSGPFVQRAEGAILPTAVRARAALAAGVDLVLRLPVGWAAASAESFASGAVALLSALGCVDLLAFGAETPDVGRLDEVANLLLSEAFSHALKRQLASGISFAAARAAAAAEFLPGADELLRQPNNILAIEYLKALQSSVPQTLRALMPQDIAWQVVNGLYGKSPQQQDLFMLPVPVALPRVGASHDGEPSDGFASASWLRALAAEKGIGAWKIWVPAACQPIYQKAADTGAMLDATRFEAVLLGRLRGMSAADFARHPGAGEGLEARLAGAAHRATSLEELYTLAKSKRFAHSRVRRLALAAALGLPQRQPVLPPFAQVLAASGKGLALLRRAKETALIPISTSLAKLQQSGEVAAHAAKLEAGAEDLHALCLKVPQPGGAAFTQPAAIQAKGREE